MNNSPDFVKDIDNSEENYLYIDFKKTVEHSLQNLKYMFKQRHPIAFNMHPVNQTTFFKVPMFPGGKSCSDAVTNKTAEKYIYIYLATAYHVELKYMILIKLLQMRKLNIYCFLYQIEIVSM